MSKKSVIITIIVFVLGVLIGGTVVYLNTKENNNTLNNIVNNNNNYEEENNTLELPTKGNDTILTTNSDTTLRIVNEYDANFFTAKKNLLIMFASWCPNCQAEISEIQKILNKYKNNKYVNIVLIAHEYQNTVADLINLVENDIDFGNVEIKIDLGRIIRKTIDPEASTIPISYVLDNDGNVLEVYNNSLTLDKAIEMIEK